MKGINKRQREMLIALLARRAPEEQIIEVMQLPAGVVTNAIPKLRQSGAVPLYENPENKGSRLMRSRYQMEQDELRIIAMMQSGMTQRAISDELGVTYTALNNQIRDMRLRGIDPKPGDTICNYDCFNCRQDDCVRG